MPSSGGSDYYLLTHTFLWKVSSSVCFGVLRAPLLTSGLKCSRLLAMKRKFFASFLLLL